MSAFSWNDRPMFVSEFESLRIVLTPLISSSKHLDKIPNPNCS